MATTKTVDVEIYQLHVWIRQISPMIWRRLLVRSDSSIADLHYTLQIAFGWSDEHLNQFRIHGQAYGVYHDGGINFSKNPRLVKLSDFKFRKNERFMYEYDFGDFWEHSVRLESRLPVEEGKSYPCCIDGQRRAPPEDCGGPLAFMAQRDQVPILEYELLEDIEDALHNNDMVAIRDRIEDIGELQEWQALDKFDRRAVNHRLKQFSANDPAWRQTDLLRGFEELTDLEKERILADFRSELAANQFHFLRRFDKSGWNHGMVRETFVKFLIWSPLSTTLVHKCL